MACYAKSGINGRRLKDMVGRRAGIQGKICVKQKSQGKEGRGERER